MNPGLDLFYVFSSHDTKTDAPFKKVVTLSVFVAYTLADIYEDMEVSLNMAGTPRGDVEDSVLTLREAIRDIREQGAVLEVKGVSIVDIGHVWSIGVTYPKGEEHIMDLTIRTDGSRFQDS